MAKMKLLFLISNLGAGGAQRSLMTIAEALYNYHDIEVHIASWPTINDKYYVPKNVYFINLGQYNKYKNNKLNYFYAVYTIRKTIKKVHPNWVIATMSDMFMRTLLGKIGLNTQLMVWEHTSMGRKLHIESRIARNFFYRFADKVLVLTNKDYALIDGKYKYVKVIPNPLSFPVYAGISQRRNVVVAMGRLDAWHVKGFDRLIEIWSEVVNDHPSWKLEIIGGGCNQNVQHIKNMIMEHHLEDRVILVGYRNDVQNIFCHSKIFVLPSRVEGFPMCLIEAMSQGCACVSFSMQGAVKDIIESGIDGYIIDDDNTREFACKLSFLMCHNKEMERISNNAISRIERFSPERIAEMWMRLL